MVFRYRETSVLLKSKSLLHFTGRRRAFDTHVCSGCVTKHPDIVPSLLGGPGALAEQKVLAASKLSADLYTLLGFVLIPAGVLTHSDKSAISLDRVTYKTNMGLTVFTTIWTPFLMWMFGLGK